MNTVGELRKALVDCPDETLLAISTDRPDCGSWDVELDGENGATICGPLRGQSAHPKIVRGVYCQTCLTFTPSGTIQALQPTYEMCGARWSDVSHYSGLTDADWPCVLEKGHESDLHVDRAGGQWDVR